MADALQIKKAAVIALTCVEKASSFASSIDPLFGIVSSLVGVLRKGLVDDESHELDKDFQAINAKLETISRRNHQSLLQIKLDEVKEIFGQHEERIRHQYAAFNNMVNHVRKDPDAAQRHMDNFKVIYERDKNCMSLNVYYGGVMGEETVFGRPLLNVYLEHCKADRQIMERRCSHLAHLFQIGLIALMAYTAVTLDDEDEIREKWAKRVKNIQMKMQEVLSKCKNQNPP